MSDEKPKLPTVPVQEIVRASRSLPEEFQAAIVVLCTKIDKGFGSMLTFMDVIRGRLAVVSQQVEKQREELQDLDDHVDATEHRLREEMEAMKSEFYKNFHRMRDELSNKARDAEETARHQITRLTTEKETEARVLSDIERKEEKKQKRKEKVLTIMWGGLGAALVLLIKLIANLLGVDLG